MKITKTNSNPFFLVMLLLLPALALATPDKAEKSGWALGIDKRSVETNWYHYNTGGATTHETFDLLGIKGEYLSPISKLDKINLDFAVGGTLFLIGDYTGERGNSTYEGDAFGFEVDAAIQAALKAGGVNLLGRVGGSVTVITASAASDNAASPYDEDFTHTIPEIYGGIGLNFPQFTAMGATSASLMFRFTLVELGATTDYYIRGDVESEGHDNYGIFFTMNFR